MFITVLLIVAKGEKDKNNGNVLTREIWWVPLSAYELQEVGIAMKIHVPF